MYNKKLPGKIVGNVLGKGKRRDFNNSEKRVEILIHARWVEVNPNGRAYLYSTSSSKDPWAIIDKNGYVK